MASRTPGRPRSQAARLAAVGAAIELITQDGHRALTMEGIARRARVSKQTLYRWWSSPAQILLEALNEGAEQIAPLEETGGLDADLHRFARRSVLGARGPVAGLLTTLMGEAQRDPAFGEAFRAGFLAHRRSVLRSLLDRAADRGDISPHAGLDLAVEVFYGTLWYRLLSGSGPIDERFADDLARLTLTHLRQPGPAPNTAADVV